MTDGDEIYCFLFIFLGPSFCLYFVLVLVCDVDGASRHLEKKKTCVFLMYAAC